MVAAKDLLGFSTESCCETRLRRDVNLLGFRTSVIAFWFANVDGHVYHSSVSLNLTTLVISELNSLQFICRLQGSSSEEAVCVPAGEDRRGI